MSTTTMPIREFIKQEVDIDVLDDICEELYIAFVGPLDLTDEGEMYFADVLGMEIEVRDDIAVVHINKNHWRERLSKAKEFFEAAAGYCANDDYEKWFKDEED